jgi:hypothetical protein
MPLMGPVLAVDGRGRLDEEAEDGISGAFKKATGTPIAGPPDKMCLSMRERGRVGLGIKFWYA